MAQQIAEVKIIITDISGQLVDVIVDQRLNSGTYDVEWKTIELSNGIYFYTIHRDDFSDSNRMIIVN